MPSGPPAALASLIAAGPGGSSTRVWCSSRNNVAGRDPRGPAILILQQSASAEPLIEAVEQQVGDQQACLERAPALQCQSLAAVH
eukprot:6246480-Alexandrium_andersonii.AAC.1